MSEDTTKYSLAAIRDLLHAAFSATDLDNLLLYAANPDLERVRDQFGPGDGLDAMVRKTIVYCHHQRLFPDLLAEVEQANQRQYARFEPHLRSAYAPAPPPGRTAEHAYLTGLRQLLATNFDTQELQELCRDLGVDYDNLRGEGRTNKARALIAYLEQRGRILELVASSAARKPQVSWASRPEVTPEAGREAGYSRFVGDGLSVLAELMQQVPEVRGAVQGFRTHFRDAREQIDTLGDHKDVHDGLHRLQFDCYNLILAETLRSQEDLALDHLVQYEIKLEKIASDLQDAARRPTMLQVDTSWIGDVVEAQEALSRAIEESSAEPLDTVRWRLGRVLAVQPVRVNERLLSAATALHLPSLVEAMTQVSDQLARLNLDSRRVEEFETGVDNLVSLNDSLTALLDAHDRWQAIDAELRWIEGNIRQHITDVERSWPDLKARTAALHGSSMEGWAESLRKASDRLDTAIAGRDPVAIRRHFQCFRGRAGLRFHDVDVDLKRLCDDLRQIGGALDSVLRGLE